MDNETVILDEPNELVNADEAHDFLPLFQLPEKSLILYEVQFELKDSNSFLCTFSRAYIQDVDLYNQCLEGTDCPLMVPTEQTIKLFEEWISSKWDINQEEKRRSSSSEASESVEETEEQAMMRLMGLPSVFGETKKKKNKQTRLRNNIDNFFKLIANLGYYSGFSFSTKALKNSSKTLRFQDVENFCYKYRAERTTKTPRYRFINPRKAANLGGGEVEIVDDPATDSAIVCSSPMSSTSDSGESDVSIEIETPTVSSEVKLNKDDMNFDFGFDEQRDSHLIAANFKKQFADDEEITKYWFQRFRLFSKLNKGILMDREGWFSVTPERVAQHIARRMVTEKGTVILDAFTGVGGNAIQFARQGAFVYAIDLDPIKIRCARRNAEIYGVLDRITFVCGDFFKVARAILSSRKRPANSVPHPDENPYGIDAIFLSPPWGGPAYEMKTFDIQNSMGGLDGIKIFRLSERISSNIGYFLPRNTPSAQVIALANNFHRVEIEQSFLNGKNKTITAYYGNLVKSHSS